MKQRLIDANKAKVILWGFSRYSGIDEAPYEYADEAIDILPTIEAIPIEFIEEQIAKSTDVSNLGELDVLYAGNLRYLIKLWEKKNGKE